ncbi:uncharacterized protein LOC131948934 [Physella acuta]|uniref:uncharacterized protein LOC131948934 n=1 Tax=Physella acuta TaxID=109671 RepID=UPI0027DC7AC2|nr:uncharacterized protein LOC131948934 [Physella acuta]XP_059166645.1 uncharacterized protein LOC131948934 [Physella acuta]
MDGFEASPDQANEVDVEFPVSGLKRCSFLIVDIDGVNRKVKQIKEELLATVKIGNHEEYIMVVNVDRSSAEMADDRPIVEYWNQINNGHLSFVRKAQLGHKPQH